jgi:hypothetical protein
MELASRGPCHGSTSIITSTPFSPGRWDLDAQEIGLASWRPDGGAGHDIWEKQPVAWRIAIGWRKFSARDLNREKALGI